MDDVTVALSTDDAELHRSIKEKLITHNIAVLGPGLSAGLSIDLLAPMCIPLGDSKPVAPKELSDQDKQRIEAAEAKRQRRAEKRIVTKLESANS
jgi:hypothetical protein